MISFSSTDREQYARDMSLKWAALAIILSLISDSAQARDRGGCLPGYIDYKHILRSIVLQGFTEAPNGILINQRNIVTEIWLGPEKRPTWTLIQRHLKSDCARVVGGGVGYFFPIKAMIDGLPL